MMSEAVKMKTEPAAAPENRALSFPVEVINLLSDSDDDNDGGGGGGDSNQDSPSPTLGGPPKPQRGGYASLGAYATSLRKRPAVSVGAEAWEGGDDDDHHHHHNATEDAPDDALKATPKIVTPGKKRKKTIGDGTVAVGAVGYKFQKKYIVGEGDDKRVKIFYGEVIEVLDIDVPNKKGKYRRCKYNDGDVEDLSLAELRRCKPREESHRAVAELLATFAEGAPPNASAGRRKSNKAAEEDGEDGGGGGRAGGGDDGSRQNSPGTPWAVSNEGGSRNALSDRKQAGEAAEEVVGDDGEGGRVSSEESDHTGDTPSAVSVEGSPIGRKDSSEAEENDREGGRARGGESNRTVDTEGSSVGWNESDETMEENGEGLSGGSNAKKDNRPFSIARVLNEMQAEARRDKAARASSLDRGARKISAESRGGGASDQESGNPTSAKSQSNQGNSQGSQVSKNETKQSIDNVSIGKLFDDSSSEGDEDLRKTSEGSGNDGDNGDDDVSMKDTRDVAVAAKDNASDFSPEDEDRAAAETQPKGDSNTSVGSREEPEPDNEKSTGAVGDGTEERADEADCTSNSEDCEAQTLKPMKDTARAPSGRLPDISSKDAHQRCLAIMETEREEGQRAQDEFRAAACKPMKAGKQGKRHFSLEDEGKAVNEAFPESNPITSIGVQGESKIVNDSSDDDEDLFGSEDEDDDFADAPEHDGNNKNEEYMAKVDNKKTRQDYRDVNSSNDDEDLFASEDEVDTANVPNSDDEDLFPSSGDEVDTANVPNSDDEDLFPSSDDEVDAANVPNSDSEDLFPSSDDEEGEDNCGLKDPPHPSSNSSEEDPFPLPDDCIEEGRNIVSGNAQYLTKNTNQYGSDDDESRFSDVSDDSNIKLCKTRPPKRVAVKKNHRKEMARSMVKENEYKIPPEERVRPEYYYFANIWGGRMRKRSLTLNGGPPPAVIDPEGENGIKYKILYSELKNNDSKGYVEDSLGQKYYTSYYLGVNGGGLDRLNLRKCLLSIADFESLTYEDGAQKTVSRLKLLVSPSCYPPGGGRQFCFHQLQPEHFQLIEDNSHLGCGFIHPDFLIDLLGKGVKAAEKFAIQVRIVGPSSVGIGKGLLFVNEGIEKNVIQIPSSMLKAPKSKTEPLHTHVALNIVDYFPSKPHECLGRLLDENLKNPTLNMVQALKAPFEDALRVLECKGVDPGVIEKYMEDYNLPKASRNKKNRFETIEDAKDRIKHGNFVGVSDPTGPTGSTGTWKLDQTTPHSTIVPTQALLATPNDCNQYFDFVDGLEGDNGSLTFNVKAYSDAHIALGSSNVQYEGGRHINDHYEIGIGGWSNSKSVMRYSTGGSIVDQSHGNYLDGKAFRKFRISWTPSILKVEYYLDSSGWSDWCDMMQVSRTSTFHTIDRAMVMTGGSTGYLPAGHVFLTGMGDGTPSKVFLTRSPCTEGKDGVVVKVASWIDMPKKEFQFLDSLPVGAVVFPLGEQPLPPTINDGDLDGDLYLCIWDEKILECIPMDSHDPEPNDELVEQLDAATDTNVAPETIDEPEEPDADADVAPLQIGMGFEYEMDGKRFHSEVLQELKDNPGTYRVRTGPNKKVEINLTRQEILCKVVGQISEVVAHRSATLLIGRRVKKNHSTIEFKCKWEKAQNGADEDRANKYEWLSAEDIQDTHADPPPPLTRYLEEENLLDGNSDLSKTFCKWITDSFGVAELVEFVDHRLNEDGNIEVLSRYDEGTEAWELLKEQEKDCEIFIGAYAKKKNLFHKPGWEKAHLYWVSEVQDLMCKHKRSNDISRLISTLHGLWKHSFHEVGYYHEDTSTWGGAYKKSLEIEKHGGAIKVPFHLWVKLPKSLQTSGVVRIL